MDEKPQPSVMRRYLKIVEHYALPVGLLLQIVGYASDFFGFLDLTLTPTMFIVIGYVFVGGYLIWLIRQHIRPRLSGGALGLLSTMLLAFIFSDAIGDQLQNWRLSAQDVRVVTVDGKIKDLAWLPHQEHLITALTDRNELRVYDLEGRLVRKLNVDSQPHALAVDEDSDFLYVANSGTRHVTRINLDSWSVSGRFAMPPGGQDGSSPRSPVSLVLDSRGRALVAANAPTWWDSGIIAVDLANGEASELPKFAEIGEEVTLRSSHGGDVVALAPGNVTPGSVWLLEVDSGTVHQGSGHDLGLSSVADLAISRDGERIFYAEADNHQLKVFDRGLQPTATLRFPNPPINEFIGSAASWERWAFTVGDNSDIGYAAYQWSMTQAQVFSVDLALNRVNGEPMSLPLDQLAAAVLPDEVDTVRLFSLPEDLVLSLATDDGRSLLFMIPKVHL